MCLNRCGPVTILFSNPTPTTWLCDSVQESQPLKPLVVTDWARRDSAHRTAARTTGSSIKTKTKCNTVCPQTSTAVIIITYIKCNASVSMYLWHILRQFAKATETAMEKNNGKRQQLPLKRPGCPRSSKRKKNLTTKLKYIHTQITGKQKMYCYWHG